MQLVAVRVRLYMSQMSSKSVISTVCQQVRWAVWLVYKQLQF